MQKNACVYNVVQQYNKPATWECFIPIKTMMTGRRFTVLLTTFMVHHGTPTFFGLTYQVPVPIMGGISGRGDIIGLSEETIPRGLL